MFEHNTLTNATLKRTRPLTEILADPYTVVTPEINVEILQRPFEDVFIIEVDLDANAIDGTSYEFRARSNTFFKNNGQKPTPQVLLEYFKEAFDQMNNEFIRQSVLLGYKRPEPVLVLGADGPTDEKLVLVRLEAEITEAYG